MGKEGTEFWEKEQSEVLRADRKREGETHKMGKEGKELWENNQSEVLGDDRKEKARRRMACLICPLVIISNALQQIGLIWF